VTPRRGLFAATLALAAAPLLAADWNAPAAEKARPNPVPASPEAVEKGRELFQKHCAGCHGEKGKGDGPMADFNPSKPEDLTAAEAQALTDGEIFWKLTHGRREGEEVLMPAFAEKIPAEKDRWRVVRFVRTLAAKP
jgi:mono/diheme cytochrome c family protein